MQPHAWILGQVPGPWTSEGRARPVLFSASARTKKACCWPPGKKNSTRSLAYSSSPKHAVHDDTCASLSVRERIMQRTEGLGLAPPLYPMMDGGQTTPPTHDHEFLSATSHPGMTDSPMAQPPSMYSHISQGDKIMTSSPHPAQLSPDTPLGKPLERPFGTPIELYDQGNRRARPTVSMNTLDPEGVNNLFRRLSTRTRRSNTQRHSNFVEPSADSASYLSLIHI